MRAGPLVALEQFKIDRVRDRLISRVAGVQVIARVVAGKIFPLIARVTYYRLEETLRTEVRPNNGCSLTTFMNHAPLVVPSGNLLMHSGLLRFRLTGASQATLTSRCPVYKVCGGKGTSRM